MHIVGVFGLNAGDEAEPWSFLVKDEAEIDELPGLLRNPDAVLGFTGTDHVTKVHIPVRAIGAITIAPYADTESRRPRRS